METRQKEYNELTDFEKGVIIGVLVGEGHFGGDGKQPHIMIKLHTRREPLLVWLRERIMGSRLYGPYQHGDRNYSMLTIRGKALSSFILELVREKSWASIDPYSFDRLKQMITRYMRIEG